MGIVFIKISFKFFTLLLTIFAEMFADNVGK